MRVKQPFGPAEEGADKAPAPGGIPQTRVNEEGFLEIFEACEEDDDKAQTAPVKKPKYGAEYVEFDFP